MFSPKGGSFYIWFQRPQITTLKQQIVGNFLEIVRTTKRLQDPNYDMPLKSKIVTRKNASNRETNCTIHLCMIYFRTSLFYDHPHRKCAQNRLSYTKNVLRNMDFVFSLNKCQLVSIILKNYRDALMLSIVLCKFEKVGEHLPRA